MSTTAVLTAAGPTVLTPEAEGSRSRATAPDTHPHGRRAWLAHWEAQLTSEVEAQVGDQVLFSFSLHSLFIPCPPSPP